MWKSLWCYAIGLLLVSCGTNPPFVERPYPPPPPPPPCPRSNYQPELYNTEEYDRIYESGFLSAESNPLSTFSIDVDAASYTNVRRFINDDKLPPEDAVRTEELINYFSYDYPEPSGRYPFSVVTEIADCPWNEGHRLVHIGLQSSKIDNDDLPPSNLVFLLDVSGSMNRADKLPLVKKAFRLLVDQLRREDRVAIVVYAGASGVALPSTSGRNQRKILNAIDHLQASGSTAGAAGIQLAYEVARENFQRNGNNRVILATDGDFNVGISKDADLVRLIEDERRSGVFLTVLGFGTGNLKDSKMEKLADKGNGSYAYIDNLPEARKVFVKELGATLLTVAKDVKIQVEFNPDRVESYRLIGYENRLLSHRDFNDDYRDAGDMGAGHSVTALYEVVPTRFAQTTPVAGQLRYQNEGTTFGQSGGLESEIMLVKIRYKRPDEAVSSLVEQPIVDRYVPLYRTSDDFRFAAAVAQLGLLLRRSEFRGDSSYDGVVQLAAGALGNDKGGYRREFVRMAEKCELLAGERD